MKKIIVSFLMAVFCLSTFLVSAQLKNNDSLNIQIIRNGSSSTSKELSDLRHDKAVAEGKEIAAKEAAAQKAIDDLKAQVEAEKKLRGAAEAKVNESEIKSHSSEKNYFDFNSSNLLLIVVIVLLMYLLFFRPSRKSNSDTSEENPKWNNRELKLTGQDISFIDRLLDSPGIFEINYDKDGSASVWHDNTLNKYSTPYREAKSTNTSKREEPTKV